jgi:tetratricopeptide (TPR) repeat protein
MIALAALAVVCLQSEDAASLALGESLLRSGRPADAVRHLEAAHRSQPGRAASSLALAYIQTGALRKAKPLIDELKAAGRNIDSLEARWLNANGDFRGAAAAFQRAAAADPSEDNLFDLGNHLIAHNGPKDARKVLLWGLERHPRSARLHVALGVAAYALGDYDEAVKALCEAVDLDPSDPRPLTFLGQMIGVSAALEPELQRRLGMMADRYPANAQALYFYGLSLLAHPEKRAQSEALFRKAAALDPKDARPHFELGRMYGDQNRLDEAIKALQRDVQLEAAHYRLARIYQLRKRPDLAEPHFAAYRKIRAAKDAAAAKAKKETAVP